MTKEPQMLPETGLVRTGLWLGRDHATDLKPESGVSIRLFDGARPA